MITKESFDEAYSKGGVYWTSSNPPEFLKKVISEKVIAPCKALDIGSGEGINSIFLSSAGFDVTAIDFSRKAISISKNNASKLGINNINFRVMDALNIGQLSGSFSFVLEWLLINHLERKFFSNHISRVSRLLDKEGFYLTSSLIDNPDDSNTINLYSTDELKEFYSKDFDIVKQLEEIVSMNNKLVRISIFLLKKK